MHSASSSDMRISVGTIGMWYSTHCSLTVMYNWGALAGVMYAVQISTGALVAWCYTAGWDTSFGVIDYITRDGVSLWSLRQVHATGASMVFVFVYSHLLRSLVFGTASRVHMGLWLSGVVVLLAMMGIAFLGYVLPWGLMSYWALTVITNLLTVIPVVGHDILFYLWGGYYITSIAIQRFYALHYLVPFIVLALLMLHVVYLHMLGSTSPGVAPGGSMDMDVFMMYYFKDMYVVVVGGGVVCVVVAVYTDTLHHADNYLPVDRFVTPRHIVPEWYFLVWYSILRACASKWVGVLLLVGGVLHFCCSVHVSSITRYTHNALDTVEVSYLLCMLVVLGVLGGCMPVFPYVDTSGILSLLYFGVHLMW
nr:apocytochrome b [Artemidia motanka]